MALPDSPRISMRPALGAIMVPMAGQRRRLAGGQSLRSLSCASRVCTTSIFAARAACSTAAAGSRAPRNCSTLLPRECPNPPVSRKSRWKSIITNAACCTSNAKYEGSAGTCTGSGAAVAIFAAVVSKPSCGASKAASSASAAPEVPSPKPAAVVSVTTVCSSQISLSRGYQGAPAGRGSSQESGSVPTTSRADARARMSRWASACRRAVSALPKSGTPPNAARPAGKELNAVHAADSVLGSGTKLGALKQLRTVRIAASVGM
mmetsp:Transcript_6535/g.14273  ORF Transcript_6535/g.14273 Transcript_6535/m.14273 type:complete len:263 (+) Transcript_6535:451-1239(+)